MDRITMTLSSTITAVGDFLVGFASSFIGGFVSWLTSIDILSQIAAILLLALVVARLAKIIRWPWWRALLLPILLLFIAEFASRFVQSL